MNQLAVLNKHLRLAGEANAKITGVESRKKANEAIRGFAVEVGGFSLGELLEGAAQVTVQVPSVILGVPEPLAVCSVGGSTEIPTTELRPVEAAISASAEIYKGNPVLEPVTDHKFEVGEPGPGVMEVIGDTHVAEQDVVADPIPQVGGWPMTGEVSIMGLAPNRRSLRAKLPDGRTVSVERNLSNWKVADSVKCRLIRAGQYPLYRIVA